MIVLQFADSGNLRDYLKNSFSSLTWPDKLKMAIEIATGLMWLHSEHIIHRDLVKSIFEFSNDGTDFYLILIKAIFFSMIIISWYMKEE